MSYLFSDFELEQLGIIPARTTVEKVFLNFEFPDDRKQIAKLSMEKKMEWYAYQFQKDARAATLNFSTKEFASFWKWHVLIPTKVKRFYYRVKNREIFKKYEHITQMKAKMKKNGI